MWTRCLYKQIAEDTAKGKLVVQFSDVDKRVLEMSKMPFDAMMEELEGSDD